MFTWVALAGLAAVFAAFIATRLRAYGRLFSDDHFLELARSISGLKSAAIAAPLESEVGLHESVVCSTQGLAVVYTVVEQQDAFIHHVSVSNTNGVTAHALGATFTAYVAELLGLQISSMIFEVGEHTVHHGEARLDPAEHAAVMARRVPEVTAGNLAALRDAAMEARNAMNWARRPVADRIAAK